ncbi:11248_t:CDS:2 [Dentiscutata erythropus]|uniref:11248_t:CDS:1 n=1 Tax=Dentiscutata erythropus TaxID=1348616 RepID=A0A9N9INV6_9GLOM|nr:11248_t:CDS:2 [Dentiscutata erythropus]
MSQRTEDITRPTIANIYTRVSNLAEVTSELSTNTQKLTTKLLDFQMNQEKANTEFLTILDKIQNQIKKLENSKYSTELDYKLSQIADTISEKITEDVEVIASDMTRFVDEVVNKAFDKVMSEINKKNGQPAKRNKKSLITFHVAKDIGYEYIYNLEEAPVAPTIEMSLKNM